MSTNPKIPKGWRELKAREYINAGDKYWSWGKGPWLTIEYDEGPYSPNRFAGAGGTKHWVHIRRIAKKGRK